MRRACTPETAVLVKLRFWGCSRQWSLGKRRVLSERVWQLIAEGRLIGMAPHVVGDVRKSEGRYAQAARCSALDQELAPAAQRRASSCFSGRRKKVA